ncbi:hypothetical protein Scep_025575 [Stephania cephalantha]|uniref:Uncharacterized protein n=1 Tax=Stephania cephalantha TaxID=152367 RepID=A0AAP0EIH8_9MAGN
MEKNRVCVDEKNGKTVKHQTIVPVNCPPYITYDQWTQFKPERHIYWRKERDARSDTSTATFRPVPPFTWPSCSSTWPPRFWSWPAPTDRAAVAQWWCGGNGGDRDAKNGVTRAAARRYGPGDAGRLDGDRDPSAEAIAKSGMAEVAMAAAAVSDGGSAANRTADLSIAKSGDGGGRDGAGGEADRRICGQSNGGWSPPHLLRATVNQGPGSRTGVTGDGDGARKRRWWRRRHPREDERSRDGGGGGGGGRGCVRAGRCCVSHNRESRVVSRTTERDELCLAQPRETHN